jgi:hypothetical protein
MRARSASSSASGNSIVYGRNRFGADRLLGRDSHVGPPWFDDGTKRDRPVCTSRPSKARDWSLVCSQIRLGVGRGAEFWARRPEEVAEASPTSSTRDRRAPSTSYSFGLHGQASSSRAELALDAEHRLDGALRLLVRPSPRWWSPMMPSASTK